MYVTIKLPEELYKKVKSRFHGHWFFKDKTFEIRLLSKTANKIFPGVEQYNPQQPTKPRTLIQSREEQESNTDSNGDQ